MLEKRLIVLEEFSGLGDGLDIALKDLDIRGAWQSTWG